MMSAIMLSVAFQLLRYRQMDIETESDILVEMCRDGESKKRGKEVEIFVKFANKMFWLQKNPT
jgi:hypothetical protein